MHAYIFKHASNDDVFSLVMPVS